MENIEELAEQIQEILSSITPEAIANLTDEELGKLQEILEKLKD